MRQRKARGFDERMEACSRYLTECPEVDGRHIYFDDDKELYVEIGCGKGNFIIKKALENPELNRKFEAQGVEFRFGPDRLPELGRTLLAHAHQLTTRVAAAHR